MIALPTLLQILQQPFFVSVTLNEHKWVILGDRRGQCAFAPKPAAPGKPVRSTLRLV